MKSQYFVLRVIEDGSAELMDRDEMNVNHLDDYRDAIKEILEGAIRFLSDNDVLLIH